VIPYGRLTCDLLTAQQPEELKGIVHDMAAS
jgi:hypothetical protein